MNASPEAISKLPAETVMQLFDRTVKERGHKPALRYKSSPGTWTDISWNEYRKNVHLAARGLIALGLAPNQGVSVIGFNCPEWLTVDLAAIHAGGFVAGIYTTNTPPQCQYIAEHSDSAVAVVENHEHLAKFLKVRDSLPKLKAIVMMKGEHDDPNVHSWSEFLKLGESVEPSVLDERMAAQDTDDICTLIYTSGTTGDPKGVMLSHDNLTWTARSLATTLDVGDDNLLLSYLPLSHIAEQVISIYVPMVTDSTTVFAESIEKLPDNLREVRPHLFLGVPRVWEKIQAKMVEAGAQSKGLKKKIATWARGVGAKSVPLMEHGKPLPLSYTFANKLVFSKVREKIGLDRARVCVSSAAPIAKETLDFFSSLGVLINEAYGMSECTGPATYSNPKRFRIGWVGWTLPGAELKVDDDGEICMRGRHVFKGYFKNEAATKDTIDEDGWLHSGDIGVIEGGCAKITDRKKDIIITAGGENIAPQVIEGKLKNITWVSQAVVVGDRQKYLSALLSLDPERLSAAMSEAGSSAKTSAEAADDPKVESWLMTLVEQVNSDLARVQRVKKIKVLPEDLSIENDELTPTMKLKRRVIRKRYQAEIAAFYAD